MMTESPDIPPSKGAPEVGDCPIDIAGIARELGVHKRTPSKWRDRGKLLEPDGRLGRSDWWWASRVRHWHAEREDG
jgi:hypothetical protein